MKINEIIIFSFIITFHFIKSIKINNRFIYKKKIPALSPVEFHAEYFPSK